MAMVCSTTDGALARPTVATITPRSVAASTSMVSKPTPWREMILRLGAASIMERGILVSRTQIASAPGRKLAHVAGSGDAGTMISKSSRECRIFIPSG